MTGITVRATCTRCAAMPYPGLDHWRKDRLTEARDILADSTQHPVTLVILAARVVASQSDVAAECAEVIDLMRLLDQRPQHTVAVIALPKGGVA